MGFITEKISDDERERLNPKFLRGTSYRRELKYVDLWSIDRDLDVALVVLNTGYHPDAPHTFALFHKSSATLFESNCAIHDLSDGLAITWTISRMLNLEGLVKNLTENILISDALKAFDFGGKTVKYVSINVIFA
jgi:hypothetical protein